MKILNKSWKFSNTDITNLDNFFNDINLAYEKPLPISREKLVDIYKILEYIPKTVNSKSYDTLYSLDNTSCTKSQKLLQELFDKNNKKNYE